MFRRVISVGRYAQDFIRRTYHQTQSSIDFSVASLRRVHPLPILSAVDQSVGSRGLLGGSLERPPLLRSQIANAILQMTRILEIIMTYSWEQAKTWECSGLVDVCLNRCSLSMTRNHLPSSNISPSTARSFSSAAYLSVSVQNTLRAHIRSSSRCLLMRKSSSLRTTAMMPVVVSLVITESPIM